MGDTITLSEVLRRERRLFQRIVDNLHRCRFQRGENGREQIRAVVEILLPMLDAHEEVEEEIFQTALGDWTREDVNLQRMLSMQHQQLKGLCKDVLTVSGYPNQYSYDHLCSLTLLLCRSLAGHLEFEEASFWTRLPSDSQEFTDEVAKEVASFEERLSKL